MSDKLKEVQQLTDEAVQLLFTASVRELVAKAKTLGYDKKALAVFVGTEYTYFCKMVRGDTPFPALKWVRLCMLVGHNPFAGLVVDSM